MRVLLVVTAAKLLGALAAWLSTTCPQGAALIWLPAWYYVVLQIIFGAGGFALVAGGRPETPARYLGAAFVLFASLFSDRLLISTAVCLPPGPHGWAALLLALQPVAFNALFFWKFAWTFPHAQPGLIPAWIPRLVVAVTAATGVILFAGNLALALPGIGDYPSHWLNWLAPNTSEGLFWAALSILTVPSLAMLVVKLRVAQKAEQRRLVMVILGLVVGTLPMVIDVLLTSLVPAYARYVEEPSRGRMVAVSLTLFMLALPAATAYAVVIDHVLDVRFIIRRAVQYTLARYTVVALVAVPVAGLTAYLWLNREQPLNVLLSGGSLMVWLAAVGTAVVVLRVRRPLIDAIDRHFFREQYDARRILVSLVEGRHKAVSVEEVTALICREVDRALHVERTMLLIRDPGTDVFRDAERRIRPLDGASALAGLVGGAITPLEVDLSIAEGALVRLPEHEREWLADSAARLLVPFLGRKGHLVAMLALGDKRSEMPFTDEDRMLLTAVAASAVSVLEEMGAPASPEEPIDSASQPALQCDRCGSIESDRDRATCVCGGRIRRAVLPAVLGAKFAIERQVGAGGMGVVYQARDLALGRLVAIKTLPRVAPREAARLRREARAMAAMNHANLAVIYGMEVWRGVPAMVLEFLPGGTLANRIRIGPISFTDLETVATAMAGVLHHLHRAGLLHRDVKPSNIGYTADGVPKLLDFGLVRLAATVWTSAEADSTTSLDLQEAAPPRWPEDGGYSVDSRSHQMIGTAAYLSPEAVAMLPPDNFFDLWGLAVTLYEALAGCNPFASSSRDETFRRILAGQVPDVRHFRPDCPASLAAFLASALAVSRQRRPGTALEFLAGIERARTPGVGAVLH